jgi:hypothetical protein
MHTSRHSEPLHLTELRWQLNLLRKPSIPTGRASTRNRHGRSVALVMRQISAPNRNRTSILWPCGQCIINYIQLSRRPCRHIASKLAKTCKKTGYLSINLYFKQELVLKFAIQKSKCDTPRNLEVRCNLFWNILSNRMRIACVGVYLTVETKSSREVKTSNFNLFYK